MTPTPDNTPTASAIRFAVDPRMVPVVKAARRLHLTAIEFEAKRVALEAIGVPPPCPVTGHYDLKAIDAWMDGRVASSSDKVVPFAPREARASVQKITAEIKLKHYHIRKGRGYWLVTPPMRAAGFDNVRCGPDGPAAWRMAKEWEDRWQRARKGVVEPLRKIYPKNSVGDAFERFRKTNEWAKKPIRTREDWDRGWKYIERTFGDVQPKSIRLERMDGWYAATTRKHGVGEAGRAMKTWRALYTVMAAMGLCAAEQDPSLAIRKTAVPGRTETWTEGEIVRLVKGAWRRGYRGLACIVAIAWDTSFSPVDVRTLTPNHAVAAGSDWAFFIRRGKSDVPSYGILSARTRRLVETYLADLDFELHDAAPIFRSKGHVPGASGGRPRTGGPYTKDTLSKDFRLIRAAVFPGNVRQLRDLRRTGAVEANAGGASVESIAAKMGNSIDQNKTLQKTYMPVNPATVRVADQARIAGRKELASGQNEFKKLKLVSGPQPSAHSICVENMANVDI